MLKRTKRVLGELFTRQRKPEVGLCVLDSARQLGKSHCRKGMSNVFASKNNHFAPICSANAAQRAKTRCRQSREQEKNMHA